MDATAAINFAIVQARALPAHLATLQQINPALAAKLAPKALLASRTPPVILLTMAVAWASTKYGLGWDDNTQAAVVGVAATLASYAMRAITSRPIAGLVTVPAAEAPLPAAVSTAGLVVPPATLAEVTPLPPPAV